MKRNIDIILEKFIKDASNESKVILIEGPRQVGKTYFVENVIKKYSEFHVTSINCEKEPHLRLEIDTTEDFDEFTELLKNRKGYEKDNPHTKIVFIDEAQESIKLGSYVRFMKEDWKNTRTILTGSSMKRLFEGHSRVPVGRIEYLTVWPFTFIEFLRFGGFTNLEDFIMQYDFAREIPDFIHNDLLKKFDEYLLVGGMPKAVEAYFNKEDFSNVVRFILASQQDDFYRKEEKIKNHLFIDAMKGIANHIGFTSKYTHITDNHYDAKKIIELLKKWFIVIEVEQKGLISTQTQFSPKRYLYDLGILRIMREVAIPRLRALETLSEKLRTPLGGLIENAVLLNMLEGKGGFYEISGWKKSSTDLIEVDFIYKNLDTTIPLEVKASLKVSNRHGKNIASYLTACELTKGFLLSFDKPKEFQVKNGTIQNIPLYLFNSHTFQKLLLD